MPLAFSFAAGEAVVIAGLDAAGDVLGDGTKNDDEFKKPVGDAPAGSCTGIACISNSSGPLSLPTVRRWDEWAAVGVDPVDDDTLVEATAASLTGDLSFSRSN